MTVQTFMVKTGSLIDLTDITDRVNQEVSIESGLCNIFVPHTTAGLMINENEERLRKDMKEVLQEIVSEKDYSHDMIDDNASAHLRHMLLNSELTVPVKNGKLQLGTWQSIFLVELDGPRKRNLTIKALREK